MLQNILILSSWETRSTEVIKGTDQGNHERPITRMWTNTMKVLMSFLLLVINLSFPWWLRLWRTGLQETWVRPLGQEDPLDKGMATPSSIFAWRIPMDRGAWWATVQGVTVGHDWAINIFTFYHLFQQNSLKSGSILFGSNFSSCSLRSSPAYLLPVPNLARLTLRGCRGQAS